MESVPQNTERAQLSSLSVMWGLKVSFMLSHSRALAGSVLYPGGLDVLFLVLNLKKIKKNHDEWNPWNPFSKKFQNQIPLL